MFFFKKKPNKEKIKSVIKSWILRIDTNESLPQNITALNFGLSQPYGLPYAYSIYLIGAVTYDENNEDWACEEDFCPKEKTCLLPITDKVQWEEALAVVSEILSELVMELKDTKLLQVEHITTGFDDGNLIVIK